MMTQHNTGNNNSNNGQDRELDGEDQDASVTPDSIGSSSSAVPAKKPVEPRVIFVNDSEANRRSRFCKNSIRTTKYSLLTFIPKNLFEQFCRAANIYFLIIVLLQVFTNLSPTGRTTTIVPLAFVLTICAVKDGYEDWVHIGVLVFTCIVLIMCSLTHPSALSLSLPIYMAQKRRLSDYKTNNSSTKVFRDGRFERVPWKNVTVGSVVRVENGESIPADMVVLATSEPGGMCFVETSSLDGCVSNGP